MKILRIPSVVILLVVAGREFNANALTETILHSFDGYPDDGYEPQDGLAQGGDSNFYGTTAYGGTNGDGTVFRISPSGTYTSLYSFTGSPDGATPYAGMVQGSDDNFYGTTSAGGTSTNCNGGCGTVFRISPSGSYTNLYSFDSSSTDGYWPAAGLVEGSDGNFYGTTWGGGTGTNCGTAYEYATSCGTVFRISPGGTETILYLFGDSSTNGSLPSSGLVQGSDGNFYGTTVYGGMYSDGVIFRISSSGNYTILYSFGSTSSTDGDFPSARLLQDSDGDFYGTTVNGGTSTECDTEYTSGCGTVFKFDAGLGPDCGASIGPTNAVFGTVGGSGSVTVTAPEGCAWKASSNAGFIAITSSGSGSGNGTVGYTVDANASTMA